MSLYLTHTHMLTFQAKVLELWQFLPIRTSSMICKTFHLHDFIGPHGDVDIVLPLQVKKPRPSLPIMPKNQISGGAKLEPIACDLCTSDCWYFCQSRREIK